MRTIIAGIVGGIVMFAWAFVAHMIIGIGDGGMRPAPNEDTVIAAMRSNLTEPGIYLLPGIDMNATPTEEQWNALMKKAEAGPTAFLVYNPSGMMPMSASQLGGEFLSNLAAAILAAFMLSWTAPSFGKRVVLATLIGIVGWMSIDVSYWNWYRFPAAYVTDALIEQAVGWFLSGLAMAFVLRSKAASSEFN